MKTSELTGLALDWAVTSIESPEALRYGVEDWREQRRCALDSMHCFLYRWSSNWAQAGEIIEREGIGILFDSGSACRKPSWFATPDDQSTSTSYEGECFDPAFMVGEDAGMRGPTPLVAAMRCFVASKLGDEIEIPSELQP